MPKQKKRKGAGDKKKKNAVKAAPKKQPSLDTAAALALTKQFPEPSRGPASWVDEICEMAAETKLGGRASDRLLSLASEPTYCRDPTCRHGHGIEGQYPTSNVRMLELKALGQSKMQKASLSSPAKRKARKQSLNDEFVSASLAGDMRKLIHLRCQVPIDCTNRKWGFTALMGAAGNGHLPCVRYLLTCMASVNIQEKNGWTALMLAARAAKYPVVQYLVRAGADCKPRTKYNQTVYGLGDKMLVGAAIQRGLRQRVAKDKAARLLKRRFKPVIKWDEDDVCRWLEAVGRGGLVQAFRENMINGDAILDIDTADLEELGVEDESVRAKLVKEIESLRMGPD